MCGIAGIIEKNKKGPSDKKIKQMIDSISHRGPDDEGTYFKQNVALGHRRLNILDVSASGHQPMSDESGTLWITFNGEIYNYIELKKELGGTYRSGTDTEVILKAYQKWGIKCVERFNGIFSFALWDARKKTLFCARDHVGVKPFYYALERGTFYFASEIKSLLAAGVKTEPNDSLIYDYLAYGYYHHTNDAFFENIHQLPAGSILELKDGNIAVHRFWDLRERVKNLESWDGNRAAEEFLKIFKNAITLQLRSDVPVGIQLSGGFDSSAVTAMVHDLQGGQKNFRLFSHIYSNATDIEKPYMRALAKALGWKWEYITLSPHDMPDFAEEVLWHQDEPFPGLPTFGLHLLAKLCRKEKIPVILGGQGGDEVGAGYEYYMGAFLLDMIQTHGAEKALRELDGYAKRHDFSVNAGLNFFVNTLTAYALGGTSADGTSFVNTTVLKDSFLKKAARPRPEFEKPFKSHLQNMQYRDILHTKLPRILHSADRAAMAYGVEQRVPLVDYRLVELGLSLSGTNKIREGEQRYFMREAMQSLMPKLVGRAPKRAVPSPQREWFQRELRPWITSILSSKSFGRRPYFDQKAVLVEYKRYCQEANPKNSFHVWQWIHLELWLRRYFD